MDLVLENFKKKRKILRKKKLNLLVLLILYWYLFSLPDPLFNDPCSTVLLDDKKELLGAKIADDGQWRFKSNDTLSNKYKTCLVAYEDRGFYQHFGVSLKGITRAIYQNILSQKRVSGGSTITMQVVRMMKKNPPRTYTQKIYEILLATRIELKYNKEEILRIYASNAPYGNNVVGIEAASWRYFGRSMHHLSWAENATLAVLPNAPGLMYPGRNQNALMRKRNQLLKYLHQSGYIDQTTLDLSLAEPLPNKPQILPQNAPHLLENLIKLGKKGTTISSTINTALQNKANQILAMHHQHLVGNKIYNGAIIITEVKTGNVITYIGNTNSNEDDNSNFVDCANAPRSSGSILKPILYGLSLQEGILSPSMLVTDVPLQYGSFSPKNFSGNFEGLVESKQALAKSLNVPMVKLLNDYGLHKFHHQLKLLGFSTLQKPARHYGLTLILGGAETKLTDLSRCYTRFAQNLTNTRPNWSFTKLNNPSIYSKNASKLDKASVYLMMEALVEVNRPDEDNNWKLFSSSKKIAWKTGTSFGFRDAWSIGVTPDYVVAVWVGNANGTGRVGLTGVKAAAPIMFDVFSILKSKTKWFVKPEKDLKAVNVCAISGFKPNPNCPISKIEYLPISSNKLKMCPFHEKIHLNQEETYRVNSSCYEVSKMKHKAWFVLPSLLEKYYKNDHPNYLSLPAYDPNCNQSGNDISFIYPRKNGQIYLPKNYDGISPVIFEIAARKNEVSIYWHLDNEFIGSTRDIHQISVQPKKGKHTLCAIDETGYKEMIQFTIISK